VLDAHRHNYLAGINPRKDGVIGLAMLELSTGDFWVEEYRDHAGLRHQLSSLTPAECLVPEGKADDPLVRTCLEELPSPVITTAEDWTFDPDTATDILTRHFGVHSLEGFGCADTTTAIGAAGAVLHYVTHRLKRDIPHIRSLRRLHTQGYMLLDRNTVANLELIAPRSGIARQRPATLLEVLDTTCTPMGARLLREWILRPLIEPHRIRSRHAAVAELCADPVFLDELRRGLKQIRDMERLLSRLSGGGNARDLLALARSLKVLPGLQHMLQDAGKPALLALCGSLDSCSELSDELLRALVDEPPATVREGGMIREGYHHELDDLRRAARDGRQWIADYQAREQERTGIRSLKVRYNKVFGYYIEVTKSNLASVPPEYVRKQTLVNAERFITDELKEYESRILGAQERARELEYEIFGRLRNRVLEFTEIIQRNSRAVALLDVISTFAERARALRYVRPEVNDSQRIRIREGRHPVIECIPDSEPFVPNDTLLDTEQNQLLIITGPNMAGKSTYIRQVALIVIMAQMGSFVPASEAEIGVVDRVFTRVGAGDELAAGRSTFMVEMQETATILHNATPRSLIVLDEIGRGTSTFDGISIAWAVAEYIHNSPRIRARTLFATHYHELTDLALTLPGIRNYNIMVKESGDRIIFLRRIVPGAADKSYGIHVARLAGLPDEVVERAREILANLEEGEFEEGQPKIARRHARKAAHQGQLTLFPGNEENTRPS
ncbi:MAG TPA: DNA mismatch repair protein MutS, partial [Lentisphaerae bacterium]|nr:DNA mismatch repair protein MutS [Lentisphaerota bacterium]